MKKQPPRNNSTPLSPPRDHLKEAVNPFKSCLNPEMITLSSSSSLDEKEIGAEKCRQQENEQLEREEKNFRHFDVDRKVRTENPRLEDQTHKQSVIQILKTWNLEQDDFKSMAVLCEVWLSQAKG